MRPVPGDPRSDYATESWVKTDAAGRFRVTALAPWAYQVGASFSHVVTDSAPFGLSMYGGAPDAPPINLSMSQALDLGILRLPPRVAKRQIHGRVESPSPVAGTIHVFAEENGSFVASAVVEPDRSFTLDPFEGRTYRIQAAHFDWPVGQVMTRGIPRRLAKGTIDFRPSQSNGLRVPLQPLDR